MAMIHMNSKDGNTNLFVPYYNTSMFSMIHCKVRWLFNEHIGHSMFCNSSGKALTLEEWLSQITALTIKARCCLNQKLIK